MYFVYPIPWWLAVLVIAAIGGLTYAQYRRPLVSLTTRRRTVLVVCRALVLALLVSVLLRPAIVIPPARAGHAIVPVLVDRSRSMRINDADGESRLARALSLLTAHLLPELSNQFRVEVFSVGDRVEPTGLAGLTADAGKSDLRGALIAVGERYRGQRVAGIVLLSDGADTGSSPDGLVDIAPVFAVGLGSPDGVPDRALVSLAAAEQRLDQTTIDLRVSATSTGFGRTPFELRIFANGSEIERRRIVPTADGAPVDEVFTVSPDPASPTVYTAEIAGEASDSIVENNRRSVLVNPAGRRRRLLVVEGAPAFEHSFMTRAWARDSGLEADVVGRKGKNAEGQDTFFVQAPADRTPRLGGGFPSRREDLYAYDAVVLANVDADGFTRSQLTAIAEFVSTRGGGLLVVGGRSLSARGLSGTPLEDVLPVDLSDRRNTRLAAAAAAPQVPNKLMVTAEGEAHSLMRIGTTLEESRRLWTALPPLASTVPLGEPRPGASVLAVATAPTGASYPVVAVQRYGRGRSMMFSGEASWRWKMLLPSTDRSFETFWRQAARWIAGPSPDQVAITLPDNASPGDLQVAVDVRSSEFAAVGDAVVSATVTSPDGETRSPQWRPSANGRYVAHVQADTPGLYHINVDARRGRVTLGTSERWVYVGGVDREFAQPRLNTAWLMRVARASGGRYVAAADAPRIAGWLKDTTSRDAAPERREIWHEPWVFALFLALLSAEWILRRRWGLR